MHPTLAALLLLQLPASASPTTPPSRDTVGYWQQRVRYEIHATLDERRGTVAGRATMVYLNNSPDTLREMYVHQYLNAFRPGSKWSAADEREGRVRFQRLRDPDYGYERFTETPTFDGVPSTPIYPGGSDSTVVRFALPRPLAPGDSLRASFVWDARPSTLPRRQGRRGRSFDLAQWYPKVAVYDRGGWEPNALVPAGEFYGEFGDYDVTLSVAEDQVIGATGVPVEGDPGWRGALRWGAVHETAAAYGAPPSIVEANVPPGMKRIRFVAHDVHHFAWSASPDYRYEGGVYVRPSGAAEQRFPTWDSVAIHVLYRPGDEDEWGGGRAVERTRRALRWLESVYGKYGYPQMTNLHRIEGGGTEFPMMMMNGSASQGLILHEGGHVFTYGILASNEWRSGWMDEGLTEYQTEWAQGLTPHDRDRSVTPLDSLLAADSGGPPAPRPAAPARPTGYRGLAVRPDPLEGDALAQYRLDIIGRAEPIGTPGAEFNEFAIYNSMIYTRAAMMYDALRDAIGDTAFRAFLRDYYARWAFRHVDEAAMRASAERAAGRDLGWFFDEWVHHTGLVDYALRRVRTRREGDGWVTSARVARRGEYEHPPVVGARTTSGWTIVRGDPLAKEQTVEIRTMERPTSVRLDPLEVGPDWFGPNDVRVGLDGRGSGRVRKVVFDWPFLDQYEAERYVTAHTPIAWYSTPGHTTLGARSRSNYQGLFDKLETGVVFALQSPRSGPIGDIQDGRTDLSRALHDGRLQFWATLENPRVGRRPIVGLSLASWTVDGIQRFDVRKSWDVSQFLYAAGPRATTFLSYTGTYPFDRSWLPRLRWSGRSVSDLTAGYESRTPGISPVTARVAATGGLVSGRSFFGFPESTSGFGKATVEVSKLHRDPAWRSVTFGRLFLGYEHSAPIERQIFASSRNPTESFANPFLRPTGAPLADPDWHYVALGGAALRGYDPRLAVGSIVALNVEHSLLLRAVGPPARPMRVFATLFGDVAQPLRRNYHLLGDAGVGLAGRGYIFDRDVRLRLDFPLYLSEPLLGVDAERDDSAGRFRVTFSFADLW